MICRGWLITTLCCSTSTAFSSTRARYRKLAASETTVFHGIREILDSLSDQLPLVIATSKPRAGRATP
jgi:phosphoglycolate phosphatase-like HAD superfamily hydrolase